MSDPITLTVTVFPPEHPKNPTRGQEFVHVQADGLSLADMRRALIKAADVVLVRLVSNTVLARLKQEQERPLIEVPGLTPPRGPLR